MEENKDLNESKEKEIELFKITMGSNDGALRIYINKEGDMLSIIKAVGQCYLEVCKDYNLIAEDLLKNPKQRSSDTNDSNA